MPFADDYNTVPERIIEWRAKYPEGTLAPADPAQPFQLVTVGDSTFLVVVAAAYRHPGDEKPGIGMAWEPVPGLTNFTRNSELQNAETSAWGRAIIAVGAADAKKGIASAEDVRNRQAEDAVREDPAVPGLRTSIEAAITKLDDAAKAELKAWFAAEDLPPVRRMNADQCGRVIDHLMGFDGPSEEAGGSAVSPAEPASSDAPALNGEAVHA